MSFKFISAPVVWRWILAALAIVLVAAIVIVALLRDRIINNPQWQVSVIGQGRVSYQPNIANVTLGVQIDKVPQATDALNQLNDRVSKSIAAVKALGIADEDIQTQNYSLFPQYDYIDNTSKLSGYNANQQLTVKVRNLQDNPNQVSRVISAATAAGANQVTSVTFDVSNLDELKQEARIKAINDAKSKAGDISRAAGVRLGKVIGWWENVVQAPGVPMPYYGGERGMGGQVSAAAPVVSPTVPGGSQEIVIEVNLNYKVK